MTEGARSAVPSRGLNKLMLIGEIGRDPEMRYTAHGVPVTTFSMATPRTWVDADGERHEATDWFNVVAWRHLAETCYECLQKGARVYVEGRLQNRSFEDDGGSQQLQVEVVAQEMILLDQPPRASSSETATGRQEVEPDHDDSGGGPAMADHDDSGGGPAMADHDDSGSEPETAGIYDDTAEADTVEAKAATGDSRDTGAEEEASE